MNLQLLLLLVVLLGVNGIEDRLEFYISQESGDCETECTPSNVPPGRPCCDIESVSKKHGSSGSELTLHLSGLINVSSNVSFTGISHLSVLGTSEPAAVLNCEVLSRTDNNFSAGFQFFGIHQLTITNVRINGCGTNYMIRERNVTSAVVVTGCGKVTFDNVVIASSEKNSMILENPIVSAYLSNVTVKSNLLRRGHKVPVGSSFTGGLKIIVKSSKSVIHVINCRFSHITTSDYEEFNPSRVDGIKSWLGFGLGGGLSIIIQENCSHSEVLVEQCTFEDNYSPFGGCLYVRLQDDSKDNSVTIDNSTFKSCIASLGGGGFTLGIEKNGTHNKLIVSRSYFQNNTAKFGGGTYLFGFHSPDSGEDNSFVFSSSRWIENKGRYSPAVDISPSRFDHHGNGLLPTPVFRDCVFTGNKIVPNFVGSMRSITSGVFVVTLFTVQLKGMTLFENNAYTALLINSAKVVFEENSTVEFLRNEGFYGGAVALHGFSTFSLNGNSAFYFTNNSATELGGAMFYHTTEQREFFASRSCFLEYNGPKNIPVHQRNITVVFSDNSAGQGGSSIFASTFLSCFFSTRANHSEPYESFLEDIGNFTLDRNNSTSVLSTTGYKFVSEKENYTLRTWPGRTVTLALHVEDELYKCLEAEFSVQLSANSNSTSKYPYTVNKSVTLFGNENDTAELKVSTQHVYRIIQYRMSVEFLKCPPGFYHSDSSCHCSVHSKQHMYYGITRCNSTDYTAVIERGYWYGVYPPTGKFYTANCPQFCNSSQQFASEYPLPNSSDALNCSMCGHTRQGVLCGKCVDGFSTYYHSKRFTCGKENLCSYGILLFIISDLVPVVVFFTASIIFDINFSSGYSNGFVFFCQMVIILPFKPLSAGSVSKDLMGILENGYNLIYGIFSLEFFSMEEMSFCLFKHATVLDVLAFKYITIMLALILIVLIVVCNKYCTCCHKQCGAVRKRVTARVSILHGLSAFLVICFAECTRVSFLILRQSYLTGSGGTVGPRVTFYGGIEYLGEEHLPYAFPAFIFLFIMCLFPVFLFLFPSLLQLLQLCRLSESRPVSFALRVTRFHTLMPLFDIFQGCFKDRLRFFAGLYFFYRVAILVPYSFSSTFLQNAIISEVMLFLILSIHSIAHPYKLQVHNVIDSLLLSNLILVNGIGIIVMQLAKDSLQETTGLEIAVYIQLLFIYLPVVLLAIAFFVKFSQWLKKLLKTKFTLISRNDNEFLEHLDSVDRYAEKDIELSDLCTEYKQQKSDEVSS